jgi:hypothetical protein
MGWTIVNAIYELVIIPKINEIASHYKNVLQNTKVFVGIRQVINGWRGLD